MSWRGASWGDKPRVNMTKPAYKVDQGCAHSELEYLGNNRGVRFLRCESCKAVFVLHSGEAWRLPATEATQDGARKESSH
jgi:nitrite reductase/ring-hydroxylating ferredoxin subunit